MARVDIELAAPVPDALRREWLSRAPGFARLPPAVLADIAEALRERSVAAGAVVVEEGQAASELYLIVDGIVDVTAAGPGGPVPLARQGPGEVFGEIALLESGLVRHATVTAATPLTLFVLGADAFRLALAAHPAAHEHFATAARDMRIAKFLKQATPFTAVDGPRLRELAGRLRTEHAAAGAELLVQGESGRGAYLLRSGRVEVVVHEHGCERRICSLGSGALFGEGALLTDAPRSATVRATEPCELLALDRDALLTLMGGDPRSAGGVLQLLELRQRPRRRPGVTAHPRLAHDGESITVLKDPSRGAYYRLSAEGFFLWERLDGRHTLRDLTMEYLTRFKALAPQAIAGMIAGLADAGFLEAVHLRPDVVGRGPKPSAAQKLALLARRMLDWRVSVTGVDAMLGRCFRSVRWIFTRPAQALLGALAVAGLVAFSLSAGRATTALHSGAGGGLLWFLVPAVLLSVLIHELGHALTTKAFGREVPRVGLGWHWFGPVAFVDTSDMWLAGRWPRIAVTLAGPYSNVLLAAVAAVVAYLSHVPRVTAGAWQFAAVSYLLVLFNLNPLLEYDGYYLLIDCLEKPNLRRDAIAWLGQGLPAALRRPSLSRGHGLDLAYGAAAVAYVVSMTVLLMTGYRLVAEAWVARWVPDRFATAVAWTVAVAVSAAGLLGVVGEAFTSRRGAVG